MRAFFAILPDPAVREQLQQLVDNIYCGRPVIAANLHMTLHFIGNTDQQDCLIELANQIRCKSFTLSIDHYGFFKRANVVWVGPSWYPATISELSDLCVSAAENCGHERIDDPFKPHVTLARKFKTQPDLPEFEPIRWLVNHFYLMLSESHETGVRYRIIQHFALH